MSCLRLRVVAPLLGLLVTLIVSEFRVSLTFGLDLGTFVRCQFLLIALLD